MRKSANRLPSDHLPKQGRAPANPAAAIEHYTYRVSWSDEDQEFVATCAEFPSLSHLAGSQAETLEGIGGLIGDVVADMRGADEDIPEPLAKRRFSGEFVTRIPSEMHRLLAIEAAEAGVSLNRLVSAKLAMPLSAPRTIRRGAADRAKPGAAR